MLNYFNLVYQTMPNDATVIFILRRMILNYDFARYIKKSIVRKTIKFELIEQLKLTAQLKHDRFFSVKRDKLSGQVNATKRVL